MGNTTQTVAILACIIAILETIWIILHFIFLNHPEWFNFKLTRKGFVAVDKEDGFGNKFFRGGNDW